MSTAATLAGKCVTGFVTLSLDAKDDTYKPADFAPFPGPPSGGYGPYVQGGYQVTLTNTGDVTAEVTGMSVAFYSGRSETGSADAGPFDTFITPGQSLAWAETTTVMDAGQTGGRHYGDVTARRWPAVHNPWVFHAAGALVTA